MNAQISNFMSFLDQANCRFTANTTICERLKAAKFTELSEGDVFHLKSGGRYFISRMDTAVIAFVAGSSPLCDTGFQIAASHIDSPGLKLKMSSLKFDKDVCKIGVEVYGGPILHTWTDRELSIAGKVVIKTKKGFETRTIDLNKPIAIIPNAAIHMNRDVNDGFKYNKQIHLQAILSVKAQEGNPLLKLIAETLNVAPDAIVAEELYLYDVRPATLIGLDADMIASGRLDNLAMTDAILSAIIACKKPVATSVAVFYDHEEIGSNTPQGADSNLLTEILERISIAYKQDKDGYYRALRHTFMISADMAHAYHPSYAEKYDPDYSPRMNKGPVIKLNANHRYASTSDSSIRFMELCDKAHSPFQKFLVRSDMPCGSTVGPMVAAHLGIHTVDIGNPMWAMHSVRETAGVQDHLWLISVLSEYYG